VFHLALTGDVVLTTIGVVGAAAIAAVAAVITSLINTRRAKAIAADTKAIATEMQPNGGSTFRDAIDRLDRRSTAHDERFGRLESSTDQLAKGQALIVKIIERIERRQLGEEEGIDDPSAP
jgi:hypothetical protein